MKEKLSASFRTEEFVPVTELIFTVTEKTVHPENSFTLDLIIMPENATTKSWNLQQIMQRY